MKRMSVFIAVLLLLLCGCTDKPRTVDFFAMDTYIQLRAACEQGTLDTVQKEICRIDELLDCHSDDSALAAANGGGSLSGELLEVVAEAVKYAKATDGCFNPALLEIKQLWNIGDDMTGVPSDSSIKAALSTTDYTKIGKDSLNGAQLDLGGFAKGYACERAIKILKNSGVTDAVLSVGGSIALLGEKTVAIQNPRGETGSTVGTVRVSDAFVATSGDYQRYAIIDGVRYHHIFGKNGRPASSDILSVSVVSDSGTAADAYSTALFVMGSSAAKKFVEQENGLEAVIITSDKRLWVSDGLRERFTLSSGEYAYEN